MEENDHYCIIKRIFGTDFYFVHSIFKESPIAFWGVLNIKKSEKGDTLKKKICSQESYLNNKLKIMAGLLFFSVLLEPKMQTSQKKKQVLGVQKRQAVI